MARRETETTEYYEKTGPDLVLVRKTVVTRESEGPLEGTQVEEAVSKLSKSFKEVFAGYKPLIDEFLNEASDAWSEAVDDVRAKKNGDKKK